MHIVFQTLAIISVIALLGPLLATPRRWNIPVIIGQLAAGVIVGRAGFGLIDAADPTPTLLADVGFALIMFVAGTHVPVRSGAIRAALSAGLVRAILVTVAASAIDPPNAGRAALGAARWPWSFTWCCPGWNDTALESGCTCSLPARQRPSYSGRS